MHHQFDVVTVLHVTSLDICFGAREIWFRVLDICNVRTVCGDSLSPDDALLQTLHPTPLWEEGG
jgi:hypothetical protein